MLSLASQAWRSWRTSAGIAALAILAFAVGIGSTVSIYTIVNAVLLKPLPFAHGERYVILYFTTRTAAADSMSGMTYPDLMILQRRMKSFDVLGGFTVLGDFNITWPGQPQHVHGVEVMPPLVNNLGVPLFKGRWFGPVSQDGPQTAVISHALWQRLGSDPNIVGKTVGVNGTAYTVTGVAAPYFRIVTMGVGPWMAPEDIWMPIDPKGKENAVQEGYYVAYARLRPGATLASAKAEAETVMPDLRKLTSSRSNELMLGIRLLQPMTGLEVRTPLLVLMGAAGMLLLITCANVSGLLVARSIRRARETAVRVALGAGRGQLATQYLIEAAFVSIPGAALGVLGSYAALRLILRLAATYIPRANDVVIDWNILLFAIALAVLTALLASLAPLWQALRTEPNDALTDSIRASAGVRSRRLSRSLVVIEIALAFTLLVAFGLLFAQLQTLLHASIGLTPERVLTFALEMSGSFDNKSLAAYEHRLLAAIDAIPGVEHAGLSSELPLKGCCFTAFVTYFDPAQKADHKADINMNLVSPGYFPALGIRLLTGRLLTAKDTTDHPVPIVINQAAAKQFWRGRALGKSVKLGGTDPAQVVGVIGDVQYRRVGEAPAPEMYILADQGAVNPMNFVVRSRVPEAVLVSELRRAIRSVNASQPIYDVQSMPEVVQSSATLQRGTSLLSAFFAAASLLMASLAVYGSMAYFVRQRRVEIGTRMAIGGQASDLLRLVLGSGLRLAGWGLGLGAIAIALVTWVLVQNLHVAHVDVPAFAYCALVVVAVTCVASLVPAWRATLLSPMVAIRDQPETMWGAGRQRFRELRERLAGGQTWSSTPLQSAETTLLTEFVEASRSAESFDEALHASLEMLAHNLGTATAILLENRTGDRFECVASVPQQISLTLNADGFLAKRLRFYHWPLPLTNADYETWTKWAETQRPAYVSELQALQAAGAHIAAALRTRREILGIVVLGAKEDGKPYGYGDKRVLNACSEQLALTLENGRLTGRIVEQEKLRRDVALAAEVQRRLLPQDLPRLEIGNVAAYTLPARTVGGDYYDFVQVGDHNVGIALADIAGKGVAAALIMSVVQASLRILSTDGRLSLPDLATQMNRFLHRSTGSSSYATFFYAQVDEATRELRYVNAGHNPPMLLRSGTQVVEPLAEGGMIIGMFPQVSYQEGSVKLQPGDIMLIFTDGVTEALNAAEEEYGEARLTELLQRLSNGSAQEISAGIAAELRSWIGTADQHDDLTFIVLKVQ